MNELQKLRSAITRIAWGYIFTLVDIKIGQIDILPSFIGFGIMLSAFSLLKEKRKTVSLLRPFAYVLIVWNVISWILKAGVSVSVPFLSVTIINYISYIIEIIELYFNFQLLTEMSIIAAEYQPSDIELDKSFLTKRNVLTVFSTVILIFSFATNTIPANYSDIITVIFAGISVITLFLMFIIVYSLFRLKSFIPKEQSEE